MSLIGNLKSKYDKWKSEAEKREIQALKNAETKGERERIRANLRIETAIRKREVAKAETEQKEAELARKEANKKLSGGGFDFLGGFLNKSKPKKTVVHHRKTRTKAIVKHKVTVKKHIKRKHASSYGGDFEIRKVNGKYHKVYI